jgi:hypothetical protein
MFGALASAILSGTVILIGAWVAHLAELWPCVVQLAFLVIARLDRAA